MAADGTRDPVDASRELRARLEAGRVAAGLNKAELARRARLGRTSVSAALNPGHDIPTPDTVGALARALKLDVPALLRLRLCAVAADDARDAALRDHDATPRHTPPPGRLKAESLSDLTAEQLEVHEAPLPKPRRPTPPTLSPYLSRELDGELRDRLRKALSGGSSALLVLTGESSTGKTRALYEAVRELAPEQPLLRPATARDLLSLLADGAVRPGTLLWLNEFQRILYDTEGEAAAAQLRLFLDRHPGVAAVATLWQNPHWQTLTRQGKPRDPYPHARALLIGAHAYRIRVPAELSPEERDQWRDLAESHGDVRLIYAEQAGARDGRLVQHLSGGPELLDAYLSGPGDHFTRHEHALITAALDAHRFGHTSPLPVALLAQAADGTLDPHHRAPSADWAAPLLDALADGERPDGTRTDIRCTLTPLRARRDAAGAPPLYEPTDYLRQHIPRVRADQAGSAALWEALCRHTTSIADLALLQDAAWQRGLFRYAIDLDRRAAQAGSPEALVRVLERTATHPDAHRIARWAAAQAGLYDSQHVERVWNLLAAAQDQEALDVLARRLVARTDPADVSAGARLAALLTGKGDKAATGAQGASPDVVQALLNSLRSHAARIGPRDLALALPPLRRVCSEDSFRSSARRAADEVDPADTWAAVSLIRSLRAAEAHDLLDIFATRITTEASRLGPDEIPYLMEELWYAGAEGAVRSLLALDVAARIGLTDAATVRCLLGVLRLAGDDDGLRTLLSRGPARHVGLMPGPVDDVERDVCELLGAFRESGAMDEFAVLADRAAAELELADPVTVTTLLELLISAESEEALASLLRRDVPGHVWYEDPQEIQPLLVALRRAGAVDVFDAMAMKLVDDLDLHVSEFIEGVVEVLLSVGADRAIDGLVTRAEANVGTGHGLLAVLALSEAGAHDAARRLAMHHVTHTTSTDLDDVSILAWYCHAAHAPDAIRALLDQGRVGRVVVGIYTDLEPHETLLDVLVSAGADEAARVFADRAAVGIDLRDTIGIAALLKVMNAAGLSGPRDVLVRRAVAGANLGHMNSVSKLLEAFMALEDEEALQGLLRRAPASQVDLNWATSDCGKELLANLRKADSPEADEFARRARAAGCLPAEPLLPYGADPDGRASAPWAWGG
ncbi:helix-turn-helix transcriptional regulator [Streptomyces sp. NPDC032198]|uniref:helix-turn-helix transcriptional regulator n=1 Tax=Streptomyces sp. NPDC032198 TaxID=3155127 RepID=UPI00340E790F